MRLFLSVMCINRFRIDPECLVFRERKEDNVAVECVLEKKEKPKGIFWEETEQ